MCSRLTPGEAVLDAINHHTSALLRKLERVASLTPDEKAALLRLPLRLHTVAAHQDLVREGDASTESFLIIEGFACRYTPTDEGKRQILSFHVSGDMPDLQSLYLGVMDHSLATLVPTRLAFVQHGDLRTFIHRHPRFGDLLWHETLIEAAVFRQWMVGLGQRSAQSRIAHLLCELFVRLRAVGLERDHSVTLPLTQAELGDATGSRRRRSTRCSRSSAMMA